LTRNVWIGAGVIIVNADSEILLVEEGGGPAVGSWGFPAGKLEMGERLTEAAVREAEEETGLRVELDDLVGIYHSPRTAEDSYGVNFVFRATPVGGEMRPSPAHPRVQFTSRSGIRAMVNEGRFRSSELISAILADLDGGRSHPLHLVSTMTPAPLDPREGS
jgi:ADP-ribose pyrophosphatase YjhB (NUDIX family)